MPKQFEKGSRIFIATTHTRNNNFNQYKNNKFNHYNNHYINNNININNNKYHYKNNNYKKNECYRKTQGIGPHPLVEF